jgi:hypothetical protein
MQCVLFVGTCSLLNVAFGEPPYKVPDRMTGIEGVAELRRLWPQRTWNFIHVNVTKDDFLAHRHEVLSLARPHISVMDMTIGPALYFAARGCGWLTDTNTGAEVQRVVSSARVLLMGNGMATSSSRACCRLTHLGWCRCRRTIGWLRPTPEALPKWWLARATTRAGPGAIAHLDTQSGQGR